jgi:hypothetical protein
VATEAAARGIGAVFYDYTKSLRAALAWAHGTSVVHRTFSLSESNREQALAAIRAGVNVAAIVESPAAAAELAARLGAAGIVDGDQDDLRFLDPDQRGIGAGYLIALTPKGKLARHDSTGMTYRLGQWPVTDTALAPAM